MRGKATVAAIALLLTAGCSTSSSKGVSSSAPPSAPTHTITGTYYAVLPGDPSKVATMFNCDPMASGRPVEVADQNGTTIGTATLGDFLGKSCLASFSVSGLPDATFYRVTIDGKAGPPFSAAQLEASGWKVDLMTDYRGTLIANPVASYSVPPASP